MSEEFTQIDWDTQTENACRHLVRTWIHEDLAQGKDWTTLAIVEPNSCAQAVVRSRESGIVCGLRAAETVLDEMKISVDWTAPVTDGTYVEPDTALIQIAGPADGLLTAERLVLNLIGHLSGVASLTQRYVCTVAGTQAKVYDTRKTTPGFRRLEKYAVRCGGGFNHRSGLYDAILIKDNHLAHASSLQHSGENPLVSAVQQSRRLLDRVRPSGTTPKMIIEVEVDTLEQLRAVFPACPNIVLLDNFSCDALRTACQLRDETYPAVQLEASGGINLDTIAAVAATGVDRISVGALTHSAPNFDVGLDWIRPDVRL